MGMLIDGHWHRDDKAFTDDKGRFVRPRSTVRHIVGESDAFPVEEGRYHLHLAAGCPWAHRVWLVRLVEAFAPLGTAAVDLLPESHRAAIDDWNARIFEALNNGVYRAGFAQSDEAHERAVDDVFAMLEELEDHLSASAFLVGDAPTEADWRLLPTLLRFDAAYRPVFGCDRRTLASYEHLSRYLQTLRATPGVDDTVMSAATYCDGYAAIPFAWCNRAASRTTTANV